MSDDSDRDSGICPQSERHRASLRVLSEIQRSLSGSRDSAALSSALLLLMRQAGGALDTSFLAPALVRVLVRGDGAARALSLSALSLIAQPGTALLSDCAPLLSAALSDAALLRHALRCLSGVIAQRRLFAALRADLRRIAECGGPCERRLCLHIGFAAFARDARAADFALSLATQCLSDCPLSAAAVALEVSERAPERVLPLSGLLIALLPRCDAYAHFKVCATLRNLLRCDRALSAPLRAALADPALYDRRRIHATALLAAEIDGGAEVVAAAGQRLEAAVRFAKAPEECYMHTAAFAALRGRYAPRADTLRRLAGCGDPMVAAMAHEQLQPPPDVRRQIVGELVSDSCAASAPFVVERALALAPKFGSWFVTLLFNLHDLNVVSAYGAIRRVLTELSDAPTKQLIAGEVRLFWRELPDDDFGIALADLLTETSEDMQDVYYLVPLNLAQRSVKFQDAMLDAVAEFIVRLGCPVEAGIVNRFESMCSSGSREVRQRACELVYLINTIAKDESPK